jgi:hypothetical protein
MLLVHEGTLPTPSPEEPESPRITGLLFAKWLGYPFFVLAGNERRIDSCPSPSFHCIQNLQSPNILQITTNLPES